MITILIAQDEKKVKEILSKMLNQAGNNHINIVKEEDIFKIMNKEDFKSVVSLEEKIIELEDNLYKDNEGCLYKAILDRVEKPLIQHALERTDGNQFKAARILGLNRNTIRVKIKRLGINPNMYK